MGELLQEGGWAMWPIYLCSIAALTVFVLKLQELLYARISDVSWFDDVLAAIKRDDRSAATARLETVRHPAARVLEAALELGVRRPDRAEAEARRVASLELQRAESYLPLLAFIAQAAPLLGLLGTVLGMVDLFVALQASGLREIDISLLSSGIWKALLTTAAGLTVAVPSLAAYSYLIAQADRLRLQMADMIQRLLNETTASEEPRA